MAKRKNQFGPAACQRSQSEGDSDNVVDLRLVRLNSLNIQPCASPILKRVISSNVVQMRRQEFEKISEQRSDTREISGRHVKSESCVGVLSGADGNAQGQARQRCSVSQLTKPKCASKPKFAQIKHSMSVGFQTDVKAIARGSIGEKPPLQPKPSQLRKLSVNREVSSCCISDDFKLSTQVQRSPSFEPNSKDENNCNYPKRKVLEPSLVVPDKPLASAPIPPPKPPRCLSELPFISDKKYSKDFESADGKYDYLSNTVSLVLPTSMAIEIVSEQKSEAKEKELSSTYESINEVASTSQEEVISKPKKSEKDGKWAFKSLRGTGKNKRKKGRHGKTIQVDNPNYMHGCSSETTDDIPCRPLVRRLSENDLDRMSRQKQELIYAEPYCCADSGQSPDPAPVEFDGQGYAIPDLENNSLLNNAQSRVKSKVINAYAVLRLPHETGESVQIEDAAEEEIKDQEQRLKYVKNVRQNTSEAIAKYERVKLRSSARLFQYGMLVGLDGNETDGYKPKVLFSIPKEIPESDSFVCNFCFPDVDLWKPQCDYEGELFSFVLTSETGDRRYGWCKRYLPPGSGPRLPEALCIVSDVGEYGMYAQLLRELQEYRVHSQECATDLMEVAFARPMPAPNMEVYIRTELPHHGRQTIILKRALDSRLGIVPYSCLLEHLTMPVLLQAFGALLLERKIIFCASSLNILSSCIGSIVALLYPFEWQHTYVTALTMSLMEVVELPAPYIIGVLTKMRPMLDDYDLPEVLVVDLDSHSILQGLKDESAIIPKKIQRALTTALQSDDDSDVQTASSSGATLKDQSVSDTTISEAFLRLFIETCSHYKDFISEKEGEETTFQREQFVKAVHSRSIRLFLDWFTQTQMFEVFMSGRLGQNVASCDFDKRIAEYQEEMESSTKSSHCRSLKKRSLGAKFKSFFRESGDKIKRTIQGVYV